MPEFGVGITRGTTHKAASGKAAPAPPGPAVIGADDVPKARFGKIMRRLLRDIAEGRNPGDATTFRDPSVLAKLQQATTQDDSESAGAPETGITR